jgi:hypothetical protein
VLPWSPCWSRPWLLPWIISHLSARHVWTAWFCL